MTDDVLEFCIDELHGEDMILFDFEVFFVLGFRVSFLV